MNMKRWLGGLCVAAALGACGSEKLSGDCGYQMDDLRDERGNPQDIETLSSGAFHTQTWWYRQDGFSRTFTWDGSTGSCVTTDATFTPTP
jgi:hypothetical protein